MEKIITEDILGVRFHCVTLAQAVEISLAYANDKKRQHHIVTPNPEMVLAARKDSSFKKLLNNADLSIPDGTGILWASAYKNHKGFPGNFSERVTGVDLMNECIRRISKSTLRVFLLGAAPGVAESVKKMYQKRFPTLQIVGVFSGSPHEKDFPTIKSAIVDTKPDVLFVAFGAPAQEKWIARHLSELPSVRLAMGVGGAFDFISGKRRRAPEWMRHMSLEWLYRVVQEPRRIKRIFKATVTFPITVLRKY